jgi:dipeptidyl aminopeptidase/acylaminoacyl peptidase
MSTDRFERDLPDLLAQLAPRAVPDYTHDIVRQTAHMRQRPSWMFPERWLPVSVVTSRAFAAPPIPWRVVGLVAILLLALAVGLVVLAGSRPKVPAPFGPAANGSVALDRNGDIFTVDPKTGIAVVVTTGPDTDVSPVFSRDGTRILFYRETANLAAANLVVADADGSRLVVITKQSHQLTGSYDINPAGANSYVFSPDGKDVLFTATGAVGKELWLAKADGSGERQLEVGMSVGDARFLPPTGSEVIFGSMTPDGTGNGIYAVNTVSGHVRTIVAPRSGVGGGLAEPSPDGSRIAYKASTGDLGPISYRVHVVSVDGTNDIELPMPPGATFQDNPEWSNDGSRLAVTRGFAEHNEDMVLAVVPSDASGFGVETKHRITGCCDTNFEWSPDDSTILVTPEDSNGAAVQQLLWTPSTGATIPAGWVSKSNPTWQRTVR